MGWKGAIRSMNAAARRAERDSRRRQRELERQLKEEAKLREQERAALEVAYFENRVERLVSFHTESRPPVDWQEIAEELPPSAPSQGAFAERFAREALEGYRPSFLDKVLKREDTKRAALEIAVEEARLDDLAKVQRLQKEHAEALEDWEAACHLARRVLTEDKQAWLDALQDLDPFQELSEVGSQVQINVVPGQPVEATLFVHGDQVIPRESKGLLKSGKLSVKQMPKTRFNELYQDCVCSSVLRIAREIFAALPASTVVVTAVDSLLNSTTGHLEEQPILSVAIPRETLCKLNLGSIDPSDSMCNFIHEMSFTKAKGFSPVEQLDKALLPV
jgi:hypothetical protein